MKRIVLALLCTMGFTGCVVGPDEVAAEKKNNDTSHEQAHAEEMIAVAKEEEEIQKTAGTAEDSQASVSADDFKKTASGLKYKVIEPGTGKRPNKNSTVLCHYRGWLDSGREFDSSYKSGAPIEFPLNGVIAGWTEGLQLIQEGGKIELEIPSRLGYGAQGAPGAIPPNARLHFTIELIKVKS